MIVGLFINYLVYTFVYFILITFLYLFRLFSVFILLICLFICCFFGLITFILFSIYIDVVNDAEYTVFF